MVKKSLVNCHLPLKALLLALLLTFLITGIAQAVIQNRKLSGEMIDDGDVRKFKISPDGRYVVFLADARTDGQSELFSVSTVGTEPVLLSGDHAGTDGVGDFLISPNSQWVVYFVSSGCTIDQIFSVPIGGGTPVELYKAAIGEYYLSNVKISPDSSRVLFIHILNESFNYREALLSIPISGGEVRTISAPDDWCYIDYQITPDSQHVIYNQEESGCDFQGLYQNDLVGGDSISLDDDQFVEAFSITPDGQYVVFTQDSTDAKTELFSIPVGGGETETLNGTLLPGAKITDEFDITPDSEYVIYVANERELLMYELYKVPVDGSSARVNITPWHMVDGGDVTSFQISPDSNWVIYRADQTFNNQFDLYSVPIEDIYPFTRLTEDMISDGDVVEYRYEITPNSKGVVLIADFFSDFKNELFAVNMTRTWGTRLNADLPPDGDVLDFRISNNSLGVIYRADQEEDEVLNLYFVPTIGSAPPLQINPNLVDGGDVGKNYFLFPFDITTDDKGVVYIADQEVDEMDELFITYDYQIVYLPMVIK